jgi:hypothetical protein
MVDQRQRFGLARHRCAVRIALRDDGLRGACGRPRRAADTAQKKRDPRFPMALLADGGEAVVVLGTPRLQVQRQVQQRSRQRAVFAQHQRDQQPADAAVAVQGGMDGFELCVGECAAHQQRHAVARIVQETFELAERVHQLVRRRRDEARVLQRAAGTAYPVLRGAELAGRLVAAAHALHQFAVNLAQQRSDSGSVGRRCSPWFIART